MRQEMWYRKERDKIAREIGNTHVYCRIAEKKNNRFYNANNAHTMYTIFKSALMAKAEKFSVQISHKQDEMNRDTDITWRSRSIELFTLTRLIGTLIARIKSHPYEHNYNTYRHIHYKCNMSMNYGPQSDVPFMVRKLSNPRIWSPAVEDVWKDKYNNSYCPVSHRI